MYNNLEMDKPEDFKVTLTLKLKQGHPYQSEKNQEEKIELKTLFDESQQIPPKVKNVLSVRCERKRPDHEYYAFKSRPFYIRSGLQITSGFKPGSRSNNAGGFNPGDQHIPK